MRADVAIVGLGPAGRALAHRCAIRGLRVVAIDPHPARRWQATYGAWADELPAWLPNGVIAEAVSPRAWTRTEHRIARRYCVLDTAALARALPLTCSEVVPDRAVELTRHSVILSDGTTIRAEFVIDARGTGAPTRGAQQTAYGVVVDAASAASALGDAEALFMDWRPDNGVAPNQPPSFLYAVPLGSGRVLLEETCLVGRPALGLSELGARLAARLAARGVGLTGAEPIERVRFAVEPPPSLPGVVAFGSRGGLMHPCTGYSVAESLTSADAVAAAIAGGGDVYRALWPIRARAVARMRAAGLRTLLAAPPEQVVPFFAAFFALPDRLQRAYLSGRLNARGTSAAMLTMLMHAPAPVRATMVRSSIIRQNSRIRPS